MKIYDGQVNDYLRAVEQALDGVPAGRRDALLADLSDHIAAKLADSRRAEQGPAASASESEVRSVLDLLGDPHELAAELEAAELEAAGAGAAGEDTGHATAAGPAVPIEINPGRKVGALIWVLITIAMVSLLCVGVVLTGVFLFFTNR
ncbi:hypothetical protein OHA72_09535 [Dactylosporangium sp. NBC_01737]|uniref:HAAS signaling domain-containing protein n=1 Tax=Dactylosporangium sp. NBC_01737 TaxID=2975959 RepID=UPI002E147274|nr:hypothetical protein OHA72_09535 [Dactylosporangium sp. NBC_01737]